MACTFEGSRSLPIEGVILIFSFRPSGKWRSHSLPSEGVEKKFVRFLLRGWSVVQKNFFYISEGGDKKFQIKGVQTP